MGHAKVVEMPKMEAEKVAFRAPKGIVAGKVLEVVLEVVFERVEFEAVLVQFVMRAVLVLVVVALADFV
jgi:hypothetical protein